MRVQHGCKRQIQQAAALLKSDCLSDNNERLVFKLNVGFEMEIRDTFPLQLMADVR